MPYIKDLHEFTADWREKLTPKCHTAENAGELNFQFTKVALMYLRDHGESYQTYNDISGAMTEALAELRRRRIAPYEDTKIAQNGDVY